MAVAILTHAYPEHTDMVRCFSEASGPFTTGTPGTSEASTGLGHQSAAAAIELCGHAWADGWLLFPELKDQNHPPQGNQPIPQLQACVLPDGLRKSNWTGHAPQ